MLSWVVILLTVNVVCVIAFVVVFWNRERPRSDDQDSLALKHAQIPVYSESMLVISAELARARRFHHRLSVVVFRLLNGDDSVYENSSESDLKQWKQIRSLKFLLLGAVLRDELRAYDIVTYDAGQNQYVVVLVESNRQQAKQLVTRIARLVHQRANLQLLAGVADFPYSGLIIEDLVLKAVENCEVSESEFGELQYGVGA